jgi:hypothetical protein
MPMNDKRDRTASVIAAIVGLVPVMIGMNLVYARRAGRADLAPELATARKRWLPTTFAFCAIVFGAAIIDFKGA